MTISDNATHGDREENHVRPKEQEKLSSDTQAKADSKHGSVYKIRVRILFKVEAVNTFFNTKYALIIHKALSKKPVDSLNYIDHAVARASPLN